MTLLLVLIHEKQIRVKSPCCIWPMAPSSKPSPLEQPLPCLVKLFSTLEWSVTPKPWRIQVIEVKSSYLRIHWLEIMVFPMSPWWIITVFQSTLRAKKFTFQVSSFPVILGSILIGQLRSPFQIGSKSTISLVYSVWIPGSWLKSCENTEVF